MAKRHKKTDIQNETESDAISESGNESSSDTSSDKKPKKAKKTAKTRVPLSKIKKRYLVGIGIALFIILAIITTSLLVVVRKPSGIIGLFQGEHTDSFIDRAEFFPIERISQIETTQPQTKFSVTENIMFVFRVKKLDDTKEITYSVKNANNEEKLSGAFPINPLSPNPDAEEYRVRYVIITDNFERKLATGKYSVQIFDKSTGQEIAKRYFSIKQDN